MRFRLLWDVEPLSFDECFGSLFAVVLPGVGASAFHIFRIRHALTVAGLAPVGGALLGQAQAGFHPGLGLWIMALFEDTLPVVPIPFSGGGAFAFDVFGVGGHALSMTFTLVGAEFVVVFSLVSALPFAVFVGPVLGYGVCGICGWCGLRTGTSRSCPSIRRSTGYSP